MVKLIYKYNFNSNVVTHNNTITKFTNINIKNTKLNNKNLTNIFIFGKLLVEFKKFQTSLFENTFT